MDLSYKKNMQVFMLINGMIIRITANLCSDEWYRNAVWLEFYHQGKQKAAVDFEVDCDAKVLDVLEWILLGKIVQVRGDGLPQAVLYKSSDLPLLGTETKILTWEQFVEGMEPRFNISEELMAMERMLRMEEES